MLEKILNFLFSLQNVKFGPTARFDFVWHYPVAIVLGILILAALAYLSYLPQSASPNKKIAMGIVRAFLIALVFLLVWRPEVVVEHEERTKSLVALWVDGSASMTLEDPYANAKDPDLRQWVQNASAATTLPAGQSRINRYQLATYLAARASLTQLVDQSPEKLDQPRPNWPALWLLAIIIPLTAWPLLPKKNRDEQNSKINNPKRLLIATAILLLGSALTTTIITWPIWTKEKDQSQTPQAATEKGGSRFTAAPAAWLAKLAESQDIALYSGATHAQLIGIAHAPEQLAPLIDQLQKRPPDGDATDVPTVVQDILQSTQGQRISALILLTDGQTTEKASRLDLAAETAQRAGTKILALPFGLSEEPFNIKLAPAMHMPAQTFVKDPIAVQLHLSGAGLTGPTPVRISIFRKKSPSTAPASAPTATSLTPLTTKDITLDPAKAEIDVDLSLRLEKTSPDKSETFDLIALAQPLTPGLQELTTEDNTALGRTTVLDAQMNVIYVDGYPRWEFRYLKNELIRETTINVSSLLLSADIDFVQDADPAVVDPHTGEELFPGAIQRFPDTEKELAKYDVILIGDVEADFFSPAQQKLIVDFVYKHGGGIGWIAGSNWNPETYRDTPMEVLLPVVPDEIDPRARVMAPSTNQPFTPVLTPAGRETALFKFFDDPDVNAAQIEHLPEMYWYKPIVGLLPQATVLAVHPTAMLSGKPMPLLVAGQYGEGRTLFSAYDDTWRWRRYTGEPLYQSYWLQFCRYLYANKALGQSKRLELLAESSSVEVGNPIKLTLNIKDPTLSNQLPKEIPVDIRDKDGRTVETITLTRAPSVNRSPDSPTPEKYQGAVTASQIGEFTLSIQPGLLPVDPATADIRIERPLREFEKATADVESLAVLTRKTAATDPLPPNRSPELAKLIPDRSIPVVITQSEELWNKPIALIAVLLLATLEWLLRKSAGLI